VSVIANARMTLDLENRPSPIKASNAAGGSACDLRDGQRAAKGRSARRICKVAKQRYDKTSLAAGRSLAIPDEQPNREPRVPGFAAWLLFVTVNPTVRTTQELKVKRYE